MPRKKKTAVQVRWKTRPKGRYATLRWTEDGARKERGLGYVTETEAEEERQDQMAALRLGVRVASVERSDVADLLIAYARDVQGRHGRSTHAQRELNGMDHLVRQLGHMQPDRVSTSVVRRYAQHRAQQASELTGKTPKRSTIFGEIETLIRAYRFGKDLGLVDCDPPSRPSSKILPEDKRPARRLTEDEVRRILAAAEDDRNQMMSTYLQVLAWSGRRPVALRSIRLMDCDRVPNEAYYPADKGGESTGWGPLTKPAADAIARRVAQLEGHPRERLLWTRDNGSKLTSNALSKPFKRIVQAAGVGDVVPYDLRKFAATRIYRVTGSIRTTMAFTGHKDPSTLLNNYIYSEQGAAEHFAPRIDWSPAELTLAEDIG